MTAMHADKTYVVYEDERLTYAEVDARVRSLARYLRETCGVDRAIVSRSRCEIIPSGSSRTGQPSQSAQPSSV